MADHKVTPSQIRELAQEVGLPAKIGAHPGVHSLIYRILDTAHKAAQGGLTDAQRWLTARLRNIANTTPHAELISDAAAEIERMATLASGAVQADEWAEFLKEGETPLQRLQREIRDSDSLATLLAAEKAKTNAAAQAGGTGEQPCYALRNLAAFPLEDLGYDKNIDGKVIFKACDWKLTVGDVRIARGAVQDAAAVEPAARYVQPPANCTCPSGDGSLRWPCPAHPPAAGAAQPPSAPAEPRKETDERFHQIRREFDERMADPIKRALADAAPPSAQPGQEEREGKA